MTPEEIYGHATAAGFRGRDAEIAVAVALAESGGNPKAHNPNPPDDSYGLWQINMINRLGPERRKAFGIKTNAELFDPATNAKAAYKVWKSQGWKGWTTYTSGRYKKFDKPINVSGLNAKANASGVQQVGSSVVDTVVNVKETVTDLPGALSNIGTTFKEGFVGAYIMGVGIVLLVVGLVIVNRGTVSAVLGKSAQVVPQSKALGKVAKVLK